MPEATIICCDCSEYMRNGDFHPSRFESQSDAVGLISNAKTQQNHENTVGLIAMHPNAKADVLVNCTQDIGRVLSSLAKMKVGDNSLIKPPSKATYNQSEDSKSIDNEDSMDGTDCVNILVALQTAQLALKHRKNKKQDQRIILFVGSPIIKAQSEKLLIKAAKRLKKNNVSVDIINFGETDANSDLLQRFIDAVKANDNSNLVTVEPGKLLSDVLISTPIFAQGGPQINEYAGLGGDNDADLNAAIRASQAEAGGAAGAGADPMMAGIDPNTDPELAMAIRLSMEEERLRQEEEARKAANEQQSANNNNNNNEEDDENKQAEPLEQAAPQQSEAQAADDGVDNAVGDMAEELDIDETDEELLKALKMSMEEANDEDNDVDMTNENTTTAEENTDNFADALLADLPGMTQNDLEEIGNVEDLLAAVGDDNDNDDANTKKNNDNNNNDKK